VAERVDARDLKSLGRKAVPVRVRPQAPMISIAIVMGGQRRRRECPDQPALPLAAANRPFDAPGGRQFVPPRIGEPLFP
jgi:hypothetical protein